MWHQRLCFEMKTSKQTQIIRQDNSITNARYDFSACQLDILFSVMSEIHDDDPDDKIYIVYAKEIENITGRQWHYKQFKDATESMGSRMFEIENNMSYKQFWIFQQVEYIKGQGRIEILFTKQAIALLKALKNNFTTYELQAALSMTSKFAKRIYQICSQWKDIGETKKYDIIEFKKMLGLIDTKGNEEFKQISALKKYCLDVAVKQINEYSDLAVSYTLEGLNGHKKPLRFVIFFVKKKTPVISPIDFMKDMTKGDIKRENVLQILGELGIKSEKIISQIMMSDEMIKEVFVFNYALKTGQIKVDKSAAGLLLTKLGLLKK